MGRSLSMAVVVAAVIAAPAAAAADTLPLDVIVTKAPVAPDGTTANAVTDFVLTFVDRDPAVDGIGLPTGAKVRIALPRGFVATGTGANTVIILQGWPQSPIVPFPYDLEIDRNRITLTLTADYLPGSDGEGGPGPKQTHLLLNGFTNPKRPGRYDIPIHIDTGAGDAYSGTGEVRIIPKARRSVNIVSFASGGGPPPPFNNPLYQSVALGEAALPTRLYVWDKGSVPLVGADLAPTADASRYRFVQGDAMVGHVRIDAPPGAEDYVLTTTGPSIEVINPITMVPTGELDTQLIPDPRTPGRYVITFELKNGNSERQFIDVF